MKLLLLRSREGQVLQLLLTLPGDQGAGEGVLRPHTPEMRRMRSVSVGSRNMPMPRDSRLAKRTFETGKQAQEWRLWEPEVLRPASHWHTGSDTCFCLVLKGDGGGQASWFTELGTRDIRGHMAVLESQSEKKAGTLSALFWSSESVSWA